MTEFQFKIGDRIKRFNPRQISAIDKAANTISESNTSAALPISDNKIQTIFKLLKKGKSLTDIVIQTGIEPEVIRGAFEQYIEFENYVLCPKKIFNAMKTTVRKDILEYDKPTNPDSVSFEYVWSWLYYYYQELRDYEKRPHLSFNCSNCGKRTEPDEEDVRTAAKYLSQNNICHQCTED